MKHSPGKIGDHADPKRPHWNDRKDDFWKKFSFKQPYARGLDRLKRDVLGRTNFDPATLWQWGTMQAMAVLKILKNAEQQFGAAGQQLVEKSITEIGYDVARQCLDGVELDPEISTAEWISGFATVMNTIAYASLESPEIESDGRVNFHIDWCPHQDLYGPFDCRVQRYFVQGMIDAAMEYLRSRGRNEVWNGMFTKTIPNGAKSCFFYLTKQSTEEAAKWSTYTKYLEEKARKKIEKEN